MANEKTKTKALKELGEKVTGKALNNKATIVGMIGEITKNYEGGAGGGAGVGKLTITYTDNTPTLDETSIAYLNTLTVDNLPASFLVKLVAGGEERYYMNYFSNISFSDTGNTFTIYYYDAGAKHYGVISLEQYEDTWDVYESEE